MQASCSSLFSAHLLPVPLFFQNLIRTHLIQEQTSSCTVVSLRRVWITLQGGACSSERLCDLIISSRDRIRPYTSLFTQMASTKLVTGDSKVTKTDTVPAPMGHKK